MHNWLQEEVLRFRLGVDDVFATPSARDSIAYVIEEAVEVQRAMMKSGYCDAQYLRANPEKPDLEGELGDLVFMVATLANTLGIDLGAALNRTLDKLTTCVEAERQRLLEDVSG